MVAAVRERFGSRVAVKLRTVAEVVAEHGEWAAGPAIDQQMSGARIRSELGWHPEHEDVVAALRDRQVAKNPRTTRGAATSRRVRPQR